MHPVQESPPGCPWLALAAAGAAVVIVACAVWVALLRAARARVGDAVSDRVSDTLSECPPRARGGIITLQDTCKGYKNAPRARAGVPPSQIHRCITVIHAPRARVGVTHTTGSADWRNQMPPPRAWGTSRWVTMTYLLSQMPPRARGGPGRLTQSEPPRWQPWRFMSLAGQR